MHVLCLRFFVSAFPLSLALHPEFNLNFCLLIIHYLDIHHPDAMMYEQTDFGAYAYDCHTFPAHFTLTCRLPNLSTETLRSRTPYPCIPFLTLDLSPVFIGDPHLSMYTLPLCTARA